jgi:hypothetical protein
LIASSESHRPIVDADASETPRSTTKRCSSVREKRESGRPCSLGSSHAIALTCATSSGGKTARATRALSVRQPLEALLAEASSPAPHDLGAQVEPASDLDVVETVRRVQDELGALHLPMRPRVAGGPVLKLAALRLAELNPIAASARHHRQSSVRLP